MPEPAVVVAMREFKRGLQAREALQMKEMAHAWLEVEGALTSRVNDLAEQMAAKKEAGEAITEAALYRMDRYKALLRQTMQEFGAYADYADKDLTDYQRRSAGLGLLHSQRAIQLSYGPSGVAVAFNRLPVEAVRNLVGVAGDGKPLGDLLRKRMVRDAEGHPLPGVLERLKSSLLTGTALGRNPRVVAKDMRNDLAGGLNKALVIARTEGLRPYRHASLQQYVESGVVSGQKRLTAHDGRVCVACLAMDGARYSLKEVISDHPNGRCTGVPLVKDMPEVTWTAGEDWFREQPAELQRRIMGATRYNLWASNAVPFEAFAQPIDHAVWGAGLQPTSIASLLERYGAPKEMAQALAEAPLVVDLPPHMLGWVTINEAATMLGYTQTTSVRNLINKGELRAEAVLVGRRKKLFVDPASVNEYLAKLGKPPIKPPPPVIDKPPKGWLNTAEVASRIKKTESEVVGLCKAGELRGLVVGGKWYVDPDSVTKYLEGLLKIPPGFKKTKAGDFTKSTATTWIKVSQVSNGWKVEVGLRDKQHRIYGRFSVVYPTIDDAWKAVSVYEATGRLPPPTTPPDVSTWLTTRQAADMLGHKTTSRVFSLIKDGTLEAIQVPVGKKKQWRVNPASVQAYLDKKTGAGPPKGWMRVDVASTTYGVRVPEIEAAVQAGEVTGKAYLVGGVEHLFVEPKSLAAWAAKLKNQPPDDWITLGAAAAQLRKSVEATEQLVLAGALKGKYYLISGRKQMFVDPASVDEYLKKKPPPKADLMSVYAITKEFGISRAVVLRIIRQYSVVGVEQVQRGRTITMYSRAEFADAYAKDKGGADKIPKGWIPGTVAAQDFPGMTENDVVELVRVGQVAGKIISYASGDVCYVAPASWKQYKVWRKKMAALITVPELPKKYKTTIQEIRRIITKYSVNVVLELIPTKGFEEHVNRRDFDDAWNAEQLAKKKPPPKPGEVPPSVYLNWISTREAANRLGLTSTMTVTTYIKEGKLRGIRVGRRWYVDPDSVAAYAASRKKTVKKTKGAPPGWMTYDMAAKALRIRQHDLAMIIDTYHIPTKWVKMGRGRSIQYVDPNAVEPYIDKAGVKHLRPLQERVDEGLALIPKLRTLAYRLRDRTKDAFDAYSEMEKRRRMGKASRSEVAYARRDYEIAQRREREKLVEALSVPVEERVSFQLKRATGKKTGPSNREWKAAEDAREMIQKLVGRSEFDGTTVRVGHAASGRAYHSAGSIYLDDGSVKTAAHEIGHAIEYADAELHSEILSFYDRRTQGDKLVWLGDSYDKDEKTRKDKFLHPYMGKDYGRRATEILSMGIEMFVSDPLRLANNDEDYFAFIYAALRE